MRLIIYELNEAPRRIIDFYAETVPNSAFAMLRSSGRLFETISHDEGSLSPWITWPTMHRGVNNCLHGICELGQTLNVVNSRYPSVYQLLADNGVRVGVFGCLHSSPLPENLQNYSFYVPDSFSQTAECHPRELSSFQALNLAMVRANKRNVSRIIPSDQAIDFIKGARRLGLTPQTGWKLLRQLFSEIPNKDRTVRRRAIQSEIAFDIFYRQLTRFAPDVSIFFTNHLASALHRYWPTIFPEDYESGKFEEAWIERWLNEIPHALRVADDHLKRLMTYCREKNCELLLTSSMGQAAVKSAVPLVNEVLITDAQKLLSYIGISSEDYELKTAMSPRVVFTPRNDSFSQKISRLRDITINGHNIESKHTPSGDLRIELMLANQKLLDVKDRGQHVNPALIGIELLALQDNSGSYAYHVPEGILIHYDPHRQYEFGNPPSWRRISTLGFAPTLLRKFGISPPSYMQQDQVF
jgi:hypothetical protein